MRRKPALLVAIALLVAGGGIFLYGFLAAEHGFFPSALVSKVERKLLEIPHILQGRPAKSTAVSTTLIPLDVKRIHVSLNNEIRHGSLTAIGKDLLLMSGSGEVFFHAAGSDSVVRSAITLPSNHLAEYRQIAQTPKYADYSQDSFTDPRYLHLLYVDNGAERLLLLSFTEWHAAEECYTNTIVRLDVSDQAGTPDTWSAKAEDWQVLFRSNPCLTMKKIARAIEAHICGGRMVFDTRRQQLLFTVGDFHWDGIANDVMLAQDDANDYGKVLAMGLDGSGLRHFAKGLRNAAGITLDQQGRVWVIENGPSGGDELNLVEDGGNYGWPLTSLGKWYNGLPMKTARQYGRHDDFTPPVFSWLPSVGMSSIMQLHGFDPAWSEDFLIGSMNGNTIFRVRVVDNRALFSEAIPFGERIRYILQPEPGVIAVWTDSFNLILITRGADDESDQFVERFIDQQDWSGQRKEQVRSAITACTQCHTYTPTPGSGAPHLVGVFNRPVARTDFPGYSDALRTTGGRWSEERLTRYLTDPQAFAPGTAMPPLGLSEDTVKGVVDVLVSLDAAE